MSSHDLRPEGGAVVRQLVGLLLTNPDSTFDHRFYGAAKIWILVHWIMELCYVRAVALCLAWSGIVFGLERHYLALCSFMGEPGLRW